MTAAALTSSILTRAGEQLSDACEFELRPDLMLMLEHEAHAEAEAEEPRSGRHPFDGHTVRRGARAPANARPRDRATARTRECARAVSPWWLDDDKPTSRRRHSKSTSR